MCAGGSLRGRAAYISGPQHQLEVHVDKAGARWVESVIGWQKY